MQFARHCRKGIAVLSGVGIEAELIQYTDAIYPTFMMYRTTNIFEKKGKRNRGQFKTVPCFFQREDA